MKHALTMTDHAIAQVVAGMPRASARAIATQDFAAAFKACDSGFDWETFVKACGWDDQRAHEAALNAVLHPPVKL